MSKVKVAVVGASGYSGEELLGLLAGHPKIELVCVTSRQHEGRTVADVIGRLRGWLDGLTFSEASTKSVVKSGAAIAFLALPHGLAHDFALPLLDAGLRVFDLSADFRLRDPGVYEAAYETPHPSPALLAQAVYGMPEIYGAQLPGARLIASPGCYPTSVILPLMPLLRERLIQPQGIVVSSASGVSGAGRKVAESFLFAECNESMRAYGLPNHRHIPEIEQELSVAAGEPATVTFAPHLLPITRGIHSTIFATLIGEPNLIADAMQKHLGTAPFVRILGAGQYPEIKNVARTNFLDIGWHFDNRNNRLIVVSAEDNLVKGAGGQAIQALNVAMGWDETTGLL